MRSAESPEQEGLHVPNHLRLLRCDIGELAWVHRKIEQAPVASRFRVAGRVPIGTLAFTGAKNVLPSAGAHECLFVFQILAEHMIPRSDAAAFQVWAQAAAVLYR